MNITKRKIVGKGKKPKKVKLTTLIYKADKLISQYIRQKYADNDGKVACVSCETILHWKDAHCAHYIGRASKATRWMEENLRPSCPSCNVYRKEFHMREYTLKMIDFYGRDFVNELRLLARQVLSGSEVRKLAENAIELCNQNANHTN